jgi:ribonuclease HIII
MAPKSITISESASAVLEKLSSYARASGGAIETTALQNGTRVRLSAEGETFGLNVYPSKGGGCKAVLDRTDTSGAEALAAMLGGTASASRAKKAASGDVAPALDGVTSWIGSDESGKGDYFGPLVTAAVALTEANWRVLQELGVRDSKSLTDTRAATLAAQIREAFPHEVIVILPPRYNQLWEKMGSVNRVLAWAHARAIENVAEKAPEATAAVADQFGDESLIRNALFKKGREMRLVQMPRAERDPAVAAASVLARAEFLRRLDQLGRKAGVRLPKGASPQVEAAARALVRSKGPDYLHEVAKVHFKTTSRVLG